tara:strand:+ start:110904 stop:111647 length:744 start_codon:yes stop_codon:yes gene_type:complete
LLIVAGLAIALVISLLADIATGPTHTPMADLIALMFDAHAQGPIQQVIVWAMTVLRSGDEHARSFGIAVERLRLISLLRVSLLAAAAVAFVGTIGFIGLVGPHMARLSLGEDHRFYLPGSALAGTLVLSLASIASKALVDGLVCWALVSRADVYQNVAKGFPKTVTDLAGRQVTLSAPPSRLFLTQPRQFYTLTSLLDNPTEHLAGWAYPLAVFDPSMAQRFTTQWPALAQLPTLSHATPSSIAKRY